MKVVIGSRSEVAACGETEIEVLFISSEVWRASANPDGLVEGSGSDG